MATYKDSEYELALCLGAYLVTGEKLDNALQSVLLSEPSMDVLVERLETLRKAIIALDSKIEED